MELGLFLLNDDCKDIINDVIYCINYATVEFS